MLGTCGPKSSSAVTITALLTSIVNREAAENGEAAAVGGVLTVAGFVLGAGVADDPASLLVLSPWLFRKRMPTMKTSATSPIIGKAQGDCLLSGIAGCFRLTSLLFFLLMETENRKP